jgi:TonB family protein
LVQSLLGHAGLLLIIVAVCHLLPESSTLVRAKFSSAEVIRYDPSEYLPPINTGRARTSHARKGQPEHALQNIISVPPEADNRSQTIVAPPRLKLKRDIPLPNMVAASPAALPVPPEVSSPRMEGLRMSALAVALAPSPALDQAASRLRLKVTPGEVIAPPPQLADSSARKSGDLNMARAEVVAPAPQLTVPEQRVPAYGKSPLASANVVEPAPSVPAGATSRSGRNLIALALHPAPPSKTVEPPPGNRRGTFAAAPDGKSGAPGTPNGTLNQPAALGQSGQVRAGLPSGLMVGAGPKTAAPPAGEGPRLSTESAVPRVSGLPHTTEPSNQSASDLEKKVFGGRKFYSMTLNMPNLNSGGGSWVIHFAELKNDAQKGDLSTPVPTHEVDPGYPLELMRQNVHGTVALYAVIHSDGTVGTVQVLRGIDDRLDAYAREALSRWRFQPATKNGMAVDLETVVLIPFKPVRSPSGF